MIHIRIKYMLSTANTSQIHTIRIANGMFLPSISPSLQPRCMRPTVHEELMDFLYYYTVLYYIIRLLYCTLLYYCTIITALYCIVLLYCTVLYYYTVLYYTIFLKHSTRLAHNVCALRSFFKPRKALES